MLEGSVKSDEKPPTVIPDESSEDEEEDKKVWFNDQIINENSLNPSLIEWIRHNQKYNDDWIFENFSIFQTVQQEVKTKIKSERKGEFTKAKEM